jgi:predicted branched-subunit amino acid permease
MPGHLHLLHYSLIAVSFGWPSLFVLLVYSLRKKFAGNNVLLATAKLSLVAFYSFIYVPYLYLFYTSSMVSLLILAFLARGMKKESTDP